MLFLCQGRAGLSPRALATYLDAALDREKRLMYLGDLVWLAAVRGAPELADSVAQYSRFCARMDGVEEEEKTGAEIYEDLLAGLEGRKPL